MMGKKRRGVSDKTTPNNNQLNKPYKSGAPKSSTKLDQIANLLLALAVADLSEPQRLTGWSLFEQRLCTFYEGGNR